MGFFYDFAAMVGVFSIGGQDSAYGEVVVVGEVFLAEQLVVLKVEVFEV